MSFWAIYGYILAFFCLFVFLSAYVAWYYYYINQQMVQFLLFLPFITTLITFCIDMWKIDI